MENIDNIMQLCRLCLVKEQVNTPIFGQNNDLEEISAKIRSCLPVKVSPDDSLPKKICDGCSYKLDLLYVFRNTSINSEKQLYQWLEQAGITKTTAATATTMSTPSITATTNPTTPAIPSTDPIIPTIPATNTTALDNIVNDAITKSEISVKQEKSDSTAGSELSAETQEYLLQQQKLPYQESFGDFNTETNSAEPEEPARKKLRRAAASKPPIKDNESDPDMPPTKAEDDSDEDMDDMGDGGMDDDDDDDEEEEEDGLDHPEFVDVPSTSAEEQPGPSGVNKDPIAAPVPKPLDEHTVECSDCSKIIRKKCWKRHLVTHSVLRPYPCNLCHKSFKCKDLLRSHLPIHSKPSGRQFKYICEICKASFTNKKHLRSHKVAHQREEKKDVPKAPKKARLYTCEICNRSFNYSTSLNIHRKVHSSPSYECHLCHKKVRFRHTIIKHLRWHQQQKKGVCDICGQGFATLKEIRTHKEKEHQILPFVCKVCNKSFGTNYTLQCHMMLHEEESDKNRCKICKKKYADLKRHMFKQHDNKQHFVCDVCGKVLTSSSSLRDHKNIHLGVKEFQCSTCGKKFSKRTTLVVHARTHTGEKPFVCNICGKKFSQSSPLVIHLRTHTGEKPYSCELCHEKFVSKYARDCHMKTKHKTV